MNSLPFISHRLFVAALRASNGGLSENGRRNRALGVDAEELYPDRVYAAVNGFGPPQRDATGRPLRRPSAAPGRSPRSR